MMTSRFFKQTLIVLITLALLTSAWPSAAQGEPPSRLPDDRLRDPGVYAARFAGTQMIGTPPGPIGARPEGANPGPWTKATFTSYRDNNWEIYTVNGDGTSSARRTFDPAVDTTPDLNRGATRLAFISTRDGNAEVYVMNADGSGLTRLTFTSANEHLPTWSPDGSKIAFYSYRDGNAEIYVMNADGSNQTRLTNISSWDGHPAWSPDGSKIVFASHRTGGYELWTMNADGSNQQQLTAGAVNASYPDWSPDGSTIVFSYDANPPDEFYDLATISAGGGSITPITTTYTYDYLGPKWDPTGQYIAYALVHWVKIQGQWYWDTAYAQVRNITFTTGWNLDTSGKDWWPDWESADLAAPRSQVTILPQWTSTTNFSVNWSGVDVGASGIKLYDIQYRDGAAGTWTDWQIGTTQTSASFTGAYGHTYYFRSRALDYAGNLEAYPGGDGDTSTTIYTNALNGHVFGNRDQPIASAIVQSDPPALNTGVSRHDGAYNLYFASSTLSPTLTITRADSGYLPPLKLVDASNPRTAYLPPIDDQLLNGQFESGSLIDWNPTGDVTATITTTVYSGDQAVQLGGLPPNGISNTWISAIEQTITVPPTLTLSTLSLVYKIAEADPVSDTLHVSIIGPTETLTYSLSLTSSGWTHQWWDVSTWTAPTATMRIEFTHGSNLGSASAAFDDINWGSSDRGGYLVYLPVMFR